jgi:hypothetical protein
MVGRKAGTTTIKADGSYVDAVGDRETEKGRVVARNGETCFTPTGGTETCFTDSPASAEGGSITIGQKGEKNKITPPAAK